MKFARKVCVLASLSAIVLGVPEIVLASSKDETKRSTSGTTYTLSGKNIRGGLSANRHAADATVCQDVKWSWDRCSKPLTVTR